MQLFLSGFCKSTIRVRSNVVICLRCKAGSAFSSKRFVSIAPASEEGRYVCFPIQGLWPSVKGQMSSAMREADRCLQSPSLQLTVSEVSGSNENLLKLVHSNSAWAAIKVLFGKPGPQLDAWHRVRCMMWRFLRRLCFMRKEFVPYAAEGTLVEALAIEMREPQPDKTRRERNDASLPKMCLGWGTRDRMKLKWQACIPVILLKRLFPATQKQGGGVSPGERGGGTYSETEDDAHWRRMTPGHTWNRNGVRGGGLGGEAESFWCGTPCQPLVPAAGGGQLGYLHLRQQGSVPPDPAQHPLQIKNYEVDMTWGNCE